MNVRNFVCAFLVSVLPAFSLASESIEVIKSENITISDVVINSMDGRRLLQGKIARSALNTSVAAGHIDYAVISDGRNIIDQGVAQYQPSLSMGVHKVMAGRQHVVAPSREKWKAGAHFSITLPDKISETTTIKIRYHEDAEKEPDILSGHVSNIPI